jgi:hypothetical protein
MMRLLLALMLLLLISCAHSKIEIKYLSEKEINQIAFEEDYFAPKCVGSKVVCIDTLGVKWHIK